MAKHARIANLNLETDEVEDGVLVLLPRKPERPYKRWFMSNQDALETLAADPDFQGVDYRVVLHLLGRLDFENYIQVQRDDIAARLSVRKEQVSRSVSKLCRKGVIMRPDHGAPYFFRLNSEYGWKGKVRELKRRTRAEHLQLIETLPDMTGTGEPESS